MKKKYDFSNSKPNPYLAKRKRQITIRVDDRLFQGVGRRDGHSLPEFDQLVLARMRGREEAAQVGLGSLTYNKQMQRARTDYRVVLGYAHQRADLRR